MTTKKDRTYLIARVQIITAMTTFGTIGVFVRYIPLPSSEIALWRGVIAFFVLSLFVVGSKNPFSLKSYKKDVGKLIFSGVAMGFNWVFLFEAFRYTTVALATLSYYFAPTLVILGSVIVFKEHLSVRQIICFIISTIGLVLIIGVVSGGSNDFIGVLYGLLAALFYAFVVLTNKATGEIHGLKRTWIQFAAASIVLFPYTYLTNGFSIHRINTLGLVFLLILGVVHTGVMYYFYFSSLSHLEGQKAAILSYIDPIVAVILSVTLLHETLTFYQLIGGLLILGATFINELHRTAK